MTSGWRLWCQGIAGMGLLLMAFAVAAATLDMAETPRLRRFGAAEGLPSRMVLALAEDRQGHIWAATDGGLVRYDGGGLRVWEHDPDQPGSLPGNEIETLLVDPLDRVWVGINGKGVARLDADRERFKTFDTVNGPCMSQFWTLAYAEDALWIGTSGHGVCRFGEDGSLRFFQHVPAHPGGLPSNTIFSSLVDAKGRLWIGTEAGLARWNGSSFEAVAPRELGTLSVLRLSQDPDGSIWVGSQNEGLYRIDAQDRVSRPRWADSASLRSALVLADRQGGYWAGTSDGLLRGDASTLRRLEGDRGSGFLTAQSGVLDLLQDHEGGLWVALLTQGLAYLPPDWRRFSIWNQLDGKPLDSQYLLSAASDGRNYYVGSAHGVYQLDAQGTLRLLASDREIGSGAVWSVLPRPDGRLWLGRAGRISVYDPASRALHDWRIDGGADLRQRIDLMRQAPDGTVWLSVMNLGLQQRSAQGQLLRSFPLDDIRGTADSPIEQIRFDAHGQAWVMGDMGIWREHAGRFEAVPGVSRGLIYDLVWIDPQQLWLARQGALERYQWDGMSLRLIQRVDGGAGVPAVSMGGLALADDGRLWATTPRGLLRWDPKARRLQQFNERDGLSDAEFTSRPPAVNADGRVLAVSQTGLVAFDVNSVDAVLPPSSLVIAEVRVRRDDARGWQPLPNTGTLLLGPDDRDLQIDARLLSYANPQGNRYRFRVRGYDQNWGRAGRRWPAHALAVAHRQLCHRSAGGDRQRRMDTITATAGEGAAAVVAQRHGDLRLHPAGVAAAGGPGLVGPRAAAPPPAMAADGAQAAAGRTGLAGQEPFPGHAGPRSAHADDWRAGHERAAAGHAAGSGTAQLRRLDPAGGQPPVAAGQRCTGPGPHRGWAAGAGPASVRPGRPARPGAGPDAADGTAASTGLPAGRRSARADQRQR